MWYFRLALGVCLFIPMLVSAEADPELVQKLQEQRANIDRTIEELRTIPGLKSENMRLHAENEQLKTTVADLRAKLASSQEEASTATSTLIDVLNKMTKIIGDTAARATPVSVRPAIDLPIVPSPPKPPRG